MPVAPAAVPTRPATEEVPPGMVRYLVGFLWKGPHHGEGTPEERDRMQASHLANNAHLMEIGAAAVVGPFLDDGALRGLFIFREASVERIRALVAVDPAIAAGQLTLELRPWLGFDGLRTNPPP